MRIPAELLEYLDKNEKLQVVEVIPYSTFKEKIRITKEYRNKAYTEVCDGFIYTKRYEKLT